MSTHGLANTFEFTVDRLQTGESSEGQVEAEGVVDVGKERWWHRAQFCSNPFDRLEDVDALVLDEVILRITDEHDQAWARQNRVVGEAGDAWLVVGRSTQGEFKVYWTYMTEDVILFLALLFV